MEEARQALPTVRPLLQELADAMVEVGRLQRVVSAMRRVTAADGALVADAWDETREDESPLLLAQEVARRCMSRLGEMGIEVKDPARGLIDFYHWRDGEVVFLCYLLGEADIEYWHTLDGGFAGRQPL
jgi:hypothetical protein